MKSSQNKHPLAIAIIILTVFIFSCKKDEYRAIVGGHEFKHFLLKNKFKEFFANLTHKKIQRELKKPKKGIQKEFKRTSKSIKGIIVGYTIRSTMDFIFKGILESICDTNKITGTYILHSTKLGPSFSKLKIKKNGSFKFKYSGHLGGRYKQFGTWALEGDSLVLFTDYEIQDGIKTLPLEDDKRFAYFIKNGNLCVMMKAASEDITTEIKEECLRRRFGKQEE